MTFLPIVERELRVASRRRFTYWSRVVAAGFLLLVFGMLLTAATVSRGMGGMLGKIEFEFLRWVSFIFCASVGIFLTSDSLSDEKREGTLGLLFLTDLGGFDIVLGKLISQSLQSFYGILAASPILALTLMVGGVSVTDFWRSMLVICNTAFFSLAIGMFVSSLSREILKAMNAAFFLSLLFLIGLPWLDAWIAGWDGSKWKCIFSTVSPGYLFAMLENQRPRDFWFYAGAQHALAWCFLLLACFIVPRTWQEKTTIKKGLFKRASLAMRFGRPKARLAFRKKLLSREPVLWLAARDRWLSRFVLCLVLVAFGIYGWNSLVHWSDRDYPHFESTQPIDAILMVGLVLWMGSQASRFFSESVRNGGMELILVAPVTPQEIVRSQWKAMIRAFIFPVTLMVLFQIAGSIESILSVKKYMATPNSGGNYGQLVSEMISAFGSTMNFVMLLAALAWFGMWMGLKNAKILSAVFKTILLVCILPLLLAGFITILLEFLIPRFHLPYWIASLAFYLLEFVRSIFFIAWGWYQLKTKFRETVAQTGRARTRSWRSALRQAPPPIAPQPLIT